MLISYKRNDQKCTGNAACLFVEWQLFSVLQEPLTDIYIYLLLGHLANEFFIWNVYVKHGKSVFQIIQNT